MSVIDIESLGEVVLGICATSESGIEEVAIVGLVLCDSVRKAARWRDVSVEDVDERVSGFLTWQAGEKNGSDVWMIDPFL